MPEIERPKTAAEKSSVESATAIFNSYDVHNLGRVKMFDLANMLKEVGIELTGAQLRACVARIEDNGTRSIRLQQFLDLIAQHHEDEVRRESDVLCAFVACGGGQDRSGGVNTDALVELVEEFGMDPTVLGELGDGDSFEAFQAMVAERN